MKSSQKLKVAMICAEYPPKSGPGPSRMAAFVKGLSHQGFEPIVLTANNDSKHLISHWKEVIDPFCAENISKGALGGRGKSQSLIQKVLNFWVPMEPSITLSLFNLQSVFARIAKWKRPDCIFVTSNPLASSVGGILLKFRHRIPLIVEFRDPWTQNPKRNWPTFFHYLVENFLERLVLKNADAIIMNTPTARQNLLSKYEWLNALKVHVISHGFDGVILNRNEKNNGIQNNAKRKIKIAYAGGFYASFNSANTHRLNPLRTFKYKLQKFFRYKNNSKLFHIDKKGGYPETILRAIALCNKKLGKDAPKVFIDFIGGEPNQLSRAIEAAGVQDYASILPRVNPNEINNLLKKYDFLYVTNPPIINSPFVGTKTFNYFATGRPIIAELPECDNARIIQRASAGWIFHPGDYEEMGKFLTSVIEEYDSQINQSDPDWQYINLFARHHQVKNLINIIEQALGCRFRKTVISEGYKEVSTH